MSHAMNGIDLFTLLHDHVLASGGSAADLTWLTIDSEDAHSAVAAVTKLIMQRAVFARNAVPFMVDHGKGIDRMVKDCHCETVSGDFRSDFFPLEGNRVVGCEARFFRFTKRGLTDADVIAHMRHNHFLPARAEHLTSLIAEAPDIASIPTINYRPIFAVGKKIPRIPSGPQGWTDGTPCFFWDKGRHLTIDWNRNGITEDDIFLGYKVVNR